MVDKNCKCKNCNCKDRLTNSEVLRRMDDQTKPFKEEFIGANRILRKFDHTAEDHLFKWHRDPEKRIIKAINENDWKFQLDNEIPQKIEINKEIVIEKGVYHRLIKGTNNLSIEIELIES